MIRATVLLIACALLFLPNVWARVSLNLDDYPPMLNRDMQNNGETIVVNDPNHRYEHSQLSENRQVITSREPSLTNLYRLEQKTIEPFTEFHEVMPFVVAGNRVSHVLYRALDINLNSARVRYYMHCDLNTSAEVVGRSRNCSFVTLDLCGNLNRILGIQSEDQFAQRLSNCVSSFSNGGAVPHNCQQLHDSIVARLRPVVNENGFRDTLSLVSQNGSAVLERYYAQASSLFTGNNSSLPNASNLESVQMLNSSDPIQVLMGAGLFSSACHKLRMTQLHIDRTRSRQTPAIESPAKPQTPAN